MLERQGRPGGDCRGAGMGVDLGSSRERPANAPRKRGRLTMPAPPDRGGAGQPLEDVFGRRRERSEEGDPNFDYDDVLQQTFPASDPPPPR
ncbi:MAG: hypothetical protein H0Z37_10680 [Firmicutes bacterium]|nr:hypothetical protein [Bacillota bacterium]